MSTFDVLLGEDLIGHLASGSNQRTGFRFTDEYRRSAPRSVLGQQFEDDLRRVYAGPEGRLPTFFANLIPEGPVRGLLEQSLSVPPNDDLALLAAVGRDLPGAVVIRPSESETRFDVPVAAATSADRAAAQPSMEAEPLRFSLAGVQMKFSVLRDAERIVLPAADELGQWLVKLDSASHPGLVQNEWATMEWARAAGFDVPECEVRSLSALPASLRRLSAPDRSIFLIRRYDRDGQRRIHQEDLAQVIGLYPECKYGRAAHGDRCRDVGYEALVAVLRGVGGREAYQEAIRRLVLMVATGNSDAHLKNWSLLYINPAQAQLSPLYDQVAVVAWEGEAARWALPWGSTRGKAERVRMSTFSQLAERVGESASETTELVRSTLERLVQAWNDDGVVERYPEGHAEAIRQYWRDDGPLLRPRAAALR